MTGDTVTKTLLPESQHLKGEENFLVWKDSTIIIAQAHDLHRYIEEKWVARAPRRVDEYDDDVDDLMLRQWKDWASGDAWMRLIIKQNCRTVPHQLLIGISTAWEMWTLLQKQYEGSDDVLKYNAIQSYFNLHYNDYSDLEHFVIAYRKSIKKLVDLEIPSHEEWYPLHFIMVVEEAFPMWAERQRSNSRNKLTMLTPRRPDRRSKRRGSKQDNEGKRVKCFIRREVEP